MGAFSNVAPGARWKPEPAERYNAVNRLLNQLIVPGGVTRSPDKRRGAAVVNAINSTGSALSMYTAVKLGSGAAMFDVLSPGDSLLTITAAASDESGLWGILQSPAASGGVATVLLRGLTAVSVTSGAACSGFLTQVSGGVVSDGGSSLRAVLPVTSGGLCLAVLGEAAAPGVTLGVLTTAPTGGFGSAAYKPATFNTSGGYVVASGAEIATTVPYLGGYATSGGAV